MVTIVLNTMSWLKQTLHCVSKLAREAITRFLTTRLLLLPGWPQQAADASACHRPASLARPRLRAPPPPNLGIDVNVITCVTPPCIFCTENHEWNIQGGVRMTLASRANHTRGVARHLELFGHHLCNFCHGLSARRFAPRVRTRDFQPGGRGRDGLHWWGFIGHRSSEHARKFECPLPWRCARTAASGGVGRMRALCSAVQ